MSWKPEEERLAIQYLADAVVEITFSVLEMAADDITHRQVAQQHHGKKKPIEQSPVTLHELNTAILNLQSLVKSYRKSSVPLLLDHIDELLSSVHEVSEAHTKDHPLSQGKSFALTSGIKRAPDEVSMRWVNQLVVSTERILACAMDVSQSQANNQIGENEDVRLVKRTRVKNFLFPQTGEGILTLSNTGLEYCRRKYGNKKTHANQYILKKRQHYHHLFVNYIGFTLKCFKTEATYYGYGAKENTIRTWHPGAKEIKPDLIGKWDGDRVPVEAEMALRKKDARKKVEQYVDSDASRVVIVCRDKETTEAYYRFLNDEDEGFYFKKPKKTLFLLYYFTPIQDHMHQAVTYAGSVYLGG